ncbi:Methyltransf_21 domain-containing protein [Meloidogyne graminicola]|uniref:Methyltransf_21 domain-containing protein n=1 Tax=Meloidogyne graminicola TaxID=189291 RepID=A0A8S9ZJR6_9BILA|nr:Methyltransf_21 domain-containing protein [Meloidogyne graminicola]
MENIPNYFNKIWGEHFTQLEPLGLQADPTEKKYFLKLNNSTSKHDCAVVTMGIGQTVDAEIELKRIYPQCTFLALDPVSEVNENLVKNKLNGTFVQRVIAAEDSYTANIKPPFIWNTEGKSEFNKSYNELSIGFFDFFQIYNSKPVIDLLIIDVEGSEFAIFQLLAEQYDQLTVTICQINVEVHNDPTLANFFLRNRFLRNFNTFIRNSKFVLIRAELDRGMYHRMFFVNYVDKICVEKFLC